MVSQSSLHSKQLATHAARPSVFGTPPRIRTETEMVLNHLPLPIGLEEHGRRRRI